MSRINDLPVAVLWRILYWVAATPAKSLFWWKSKLPLLAVCRLWTKLAQPLVFSHVYIELFEGCSVSDAFVNDSSKGSCIAWKSNAELLIARRCTLLAQRLTMEITDCSTTDYLRRIALDVLQLDHVDWMHINTLTTVYVSLVCKHSVKSAGIDDSAEAGIVHTVQYFGQNMRNIAELNLDFITFRSICECLCTNFALIYGGQLQILRAQGPFALPISYFSRTIAVLELTLDSSAGRSVLPSICGETLRVLKLSNVPRNFAWHHFRYNVFVRPIVFRRLTVLSIAYNSGSMLSAMEDTLAKAALGANNCDQLCFPVLKSLTINSCTPDCDLLYADTPFPELDKVDMSGQLEEIRHCSRLKLTWVGNLIIDVLLLDTDDMTDFYSATNHFFSAVCIGRTARLDINGVHAPIDPELIRWANLTNLGVHTVSFVTSCKLISRLPNLTGFHADSMEFGAELVDAFSVDESLFLTTDPLLAWGAKLATLTIQEVMAGCPISASARGIQALIVHAAVLKELTVPEPLELPLTAFVDTSKERHPHLANVRVRSC
ncbi:hypothetical protein GGF42_001737 [Coemansia sp. RSA 2424]|nr:hypothetical protein GGF42_001737 [Coemansia sp. RSA 2424]